MSIATRAGPTSRAFRVAACYRHSGLTDLKRTRDVFSVARTMARDRPSLYGEGVAFFFVARGPVPRDRWIARARTMERETRIKTREGAPTRIYETP